ncbi:Hint_2 domain-containing protein [Rhodovastum atsumiense]|nr:Hint_2 domain-containing protein [Rhodovastum atsumiense]
MMRDRRNGEDGAMPDILSVNGDVPGFVRGTRIQTDKGEQPVETLEPGTGVVTASGRIRPILWVGRRRLEPRRHPRPELIHPVRIRRGAAGNFLPRRDLLVSPSLTIGAGNITVGVWQLVNGATLASVASPDPIEYVHIALDSPDLLLAEGLPAESLHEDRRAGFENGGTVMVLHPHLAWHPGATTPPEAMVQALRRRLLQRAHTLGHAITRDPGLHLRADGWPLSPVLVAGPMHRFALPAGVTDLRIVSRAGVPAEIDAVSQDRRRLGVMLERIALRGPQGEREIPPDDPVLSEGFHPHEQAEGRSWRWTDGHARLPGRVLAGMTWVDLYVAGSQSAWAGTAPPAAPVTRSA